MEWSFQRIPKFPGKVGFPYCEVTARIYQLNHQTQSIILAERHWTSLGDREELFSGWLWLRQTAELCPSPSTKSIGDATHGNTPPRGFIECTSTSQKYKVEDNSTRPDTPWIISDSCEKIGNGRMFITSHREIWSRAPHQEKLPPPRGRLEDAISFQEIQGRSQLDSISSKSLWHILS